MKTTYTCLLLTLILSVASSQTIEFRAKIEDGEGTCYYCPGFDFIIDCTSTALSSSVYNLNLYVGEYVQCTGQWNGSTTAPSIDITALQIVPESFSIGGGAHIGTSADFTAHGNPGDLAVIAIALATDFTFIASNRALLLDLNSLVVLGSDVMGSNGEAEVTVAIPDEPILVGLAVYGQAYIIPQGAGAAYFSNPDCKQISN